MVGKVAKRGRPRKEKNKYIYIVWGGSAYLDNVYIHCVFSDAIVAQNYVYKYNLLVKEVNESNTNKVEPLYMQELVLNKCLSDRPCVVYRVIYDRGLEGVYGEVFVGDENEYIQDEKLLIVENKGDIVICHSVMCFESALRRLNTHLGSNYEVSDISMKLKNNEGE